MGGCDQSQKKMKLKKFKKYKSVPKTLPKSHNDDNLIFFPFSRDGALLSRAGMRLWIF